MSAFIMRPSFVQDPVHADGRTTLDEIARRHPESIPVLRLFSIEPNEPGAEPLAAIALRHRLDLAVLLRALNARS